MQRAGRIPLFFQKSAITLCAVNRVSKAILIAAGGLAALVAAGAIGVNLYVQSPGAQARIQAELSQALNVPLEITHTTVTPWSGLRISGLAVPGDGRKLLEADSFTARYRLLPLFKKRLVISEMLLDSPRIVWAQNDEGKWVLPLLPDKKPKSETGPGEKPATQKKEREKGAFEVEVAGLEIRHGSIEMLDAQGEPFATASDVNMAWSFADPTQVAGTLSAARMTWKETLVFTAVRSPFRHTHGELTFPALEAALAEGAVRGSLRVQTGEKGSPFAVALSFEKVDLARLTAEAGWQPGQAAGALSGNLDLNGNTRKLARLEGTGRLALADGQFRQLDFFQTIGQVLQIAELSNLRLREAHADFHLADEKTYIDDLMLETPDLSLGAKGTARFDGKLALDAQLAVSDRLSRQLPGFVRDNFDLTDAAGRKAISFKISGKTDKPKYDLLDRIVGQQIGAQFDDLVSSIFGGGKKKKDDGKDGKESKKKKKDGDAKTPPEPAATASPGAAPEIREP